MFDTVELRASTIGIGMPFRLTLPWASGVLNSPARAHVCGSYAYDFTEGIIFGPYYSAEYASYTPGSVEGTTYVSGSFEGASYLAGGVEYASYTPGSIEGASYVPGSTESVSI